MHSVYPHRRSEDQQLEIIAQLDAPHAATSPPHLDRTAQIAPRHLRALNNLKIDFKLEKWIFNSGKSLEIH